MDDSIFYDALPLPDEVEKEFLDKAGDNSFARKWLEDRDIDTAPQNVALIQYGIVWNPDTGRYQFLIYGPDHVGPKRRPALGVPILENGEFIDLLLIGDFISFDDGESDDRYFETVCCRASWLGRGNLSGPIVRLHPHPLDWIAAGCTGACHIAPISRAALKDLQAVATIECNCIHTALEAWDWGFGGEDDELARFEIDDTPVSVRQYFEDEVRWRVLHRLRMEGLPVGVDAKSDAEYVAYLEKMRAEYVYVGDASETESRS
jgi:hypothetical protein